MYACFDVLVLQQVVEYVDGRLAGEEHLDDEVRGAAIDGDGRTRRVRTLDQRNQHLQTHMHHIQRRPWKNRGLLLTSTPFPSQNVCIT